MKTLCSVVQGLLFIVVAAVFPCLLKGQEPGSARTFTDLIHFLGSQKQEEPLAAAEGIAQQPAVNQLAKMLSWLSPTTMSNSLVMTKSGSPQGQQRVVAWQNTPQGLLLVGFPFGPAAHVSSLKVEFLQIHSPQPGHPLPSSYFSFAEILLKSNESPVFQALSPSTSTSCYNCHRAQRVRTLDFLDRKQQRVTSAEVQDRLAGAPIWQSFFLGVEDDFWPGAFASQARGILPHIEGVIDPNQAQILQEALTVPHKAELLRQLPWLDPSTPTGAQTLQAINEAATTNTERHLPFNQPFRFTTTLYSEYWKILAAELYDRLQHSEFLPLAVEILEARHVGTTHGLDHLLSTLRQKWPNVSGRLWSHFEYSLTSAAEARKAQMIRETLAQLIHPRFINSQQYPTRSRLREELLRFLPLETRQAQQFSRRSAVEELVNIYETQPQAEPFQRLARNPDIKMAIQMELIDRILVSQGKEPLAWGLQQFQPWSPSSGWGQNALRVIGQHLANWVENEKRGAPLSDPLPAHLLKKLWTTFSDRTRKPLICQSLIAGR